MRLKREDILYAQSESVQVLHRKEASFPFNWHWHEEVEITWITHGSGLRRIGKDVLDYHAPECVILPSRVPHSWASKSKGGHEAWVCQFRLDLPIFDQEEMSGLKKWLSQPCALMAPVKKIDEFEGLLQAKGVKRWALLLEMLDKLSRKRWRRLEPSEKVERRHVGHENWMDRIHTWLDKGGPISVPDLAREMACSESSLRRYVRKQTKGSLVDLLNDWRIERAKGLLKGSEESVLNISMEVGYDNASHFHRQFKKRCGVTPRQYRHDSA